MKVSVITATYNREKTVRRAIVSIKSQNYSNIEVVVVDGASTDRTVEYVMPLLDESDVFLTENDAGIYDALNKGITLASGDIIAFLHSDDLYFDDDVISKVVSLFADDGVDVVCGDVCFFSEESIETVTRIYRSDKLTSKNLAWGKMPAHPAIFIRKRIYERIGIFKTTYRIAADYEFLCRLATTPKINAMYLRSILVKMQTGGISTGGLRNTILLNREVLRACAENRIYTNILMVLSKYPSKLLQFFTRLKTA
jgi:glycosyltransferase involved in cell wall biosynthesis